MQLEQTPIDEFPPIDNTLQHHASHNEYSETRIQTEQGGSVVVNLDDIMQVRFEQDTGVIRAEGTIPTELDYQMVKHKGGSIHKFSFGNRLYTITTIVEPDVLKSDSETPTPARWLVVNHPAVNHLFSGEAAAEETDFYDTPSIQLYQTIQSEVDELTAIPSEQQRMTYAVQIETLIRSMALRSKEIEERGTKTVLRRNSVSLINIIEPVEHITARNSDLDELKSFINEFIPKDYREQLYYLFIDKNRVNLQSHISDSLSKSKLNIFQIDLLINVYSFYRDYQDKFNELLTYWRSKSSEGVFIRATFEELVNLHIGNKIKRGSPQERIYDWITNADIDSFPEVDTVQQRTKGENIIMKTISPPQMDVVGGKPFENDATELRDAIGNTITGADGIDSIPFNQFAILTKEHLNEYYASLKKRCLDFESEGYKVMFFIPDRFDNSGYEHNRLIYSTPRSSAWLFNKFWNYLRTTEANNIGKLRPGFTFNPSHIAKYAKELVQSGQKVKIIVPDDFAYSFTKVGGAQFSNLFKALESEGFNADQMRDMVEVNLVAANVENIPETQRVLKTITKPNGRSEDIPTDIDRMYNLRVLYGFSYGTEFTGTWGDCDYCLRNIRTIISDAVEKGKVTKEQISSIRISETSIGSILDPQKPYSTNETKGEIIGFYQGAYNGDPKRGIFLWHESTNGKNTLRPVKR